MDLAAITLITLACWTAMSVLAALSLMDPG
jgi:hypothetical protein